MANVKNITDVPVATSTDGLNLIVNDNGSAKQIAASAVGAQANWDETDEASPAFIMNKPTISSIVQYTISGESLNGIVYNSSNPISLSEFKNDFFNNVIRITNNDSGYIGTVVGYSLSGNYLVLMYTTTTGVDTRQFWVNKNA